MLSGIHEPGSSHHELLRAFTDDTTLGRVDDELGTHDYRTHEFGDSVLMERNAGVPDGWWFVINAIGRYLSF